MYYPRETGALMSWLWRGMWIPNHVASVWQNVDTMGSAEYKKQHIWQFKDVSLKHVVGYLRTRALM